MEPMPVPVQPELPLLAVLGYAVCALGGLGTLICGIMVGVKILNKNGTGPGVLAIILAVICNLATFIWGWVKVGELEAKGIMKFYTISFVVSVLGGIVAGVGMFMFAAKMQGQMQNQMPPMPDSSLEQVVPQQQ